MTMADSLNITNLSRRGILGTGLAAAGAFAVAAVPAFASVGTDSKLLQLCRNYERLDRAYARACAASDDAQQARWAREAKRSAKQKPVPPRPKELTGKLDVWPEAAGPFGLIDLERKDVRKVLGELAEGTHKIFAMFLPRGSVAADAWSVPAPEWARAKARELLPIYDDWAAKGGVPKAKRERRSPAEVKADRVLERISKMQIATGAAIGALPAQTVAGIRARLALIKSDAWSKGEQFGTDYPPLVPVLNSVVQDIDRVDLSARLNPRLEPISATERSA
jgi:hypothetical protein